MFGINLNYIFVGIIISLSLSTGYYYVSSLSKENQLIKNESTIKDLNSDISLLKKNNETIKKTCEAEKTSLEFLLKEKNKINEKEKNTLGELENVKKEKIPTVNNLSSPLPSGLSRLLNKHCSEIRGQACENP